MQIAQAGAGAAGSDPGGAKLVSSAGGVTSAAKSAAAATNPAALAAASDVAMVRELAAADLLKLSQILQPVQEPDKVALIDSLLREAIQAVEEGRVEWAVGRLVEVVTLHPQRAEELKAATEFSPIRDNVEHLLSRLTNVAKMDAEGKLTQAEQVLADGGWKKLPNWETRPETLLQIARNLFEAGGYANYVRTGELAQATVQSAYWEATLMQEEIQTSRAMPGTRSFEQTAPQKGPKTVRPLPPLLKAIWIRAPLLVLMFAWLAIGVSGGVLSLIVRKLSPESWLASFSNTCFDLWGIGFLALVGFGFIARVRRPRS